MCPEFSERRTEMTYESDTMVKDGMVAVHPSLDGRRVHIIVIPIDVPRTNAKNPIDELFAQAIPDIRFTPLTRDEAHARP